jgi:hypothetical protein
MTLGKGPESVARSALLAKTCRFKAKSLDGHEDRPIWRLQGHVAASPFLSRQENEDRFQQLFMP